MDDEIRPAGGFREELDDTLTPEVQELRAALNKDWNMPSTMTPNHVIIDQETAELQKHAAKTLNEAFYPAGEMHDCDNDGVALTSVEHPQDMRFIERLARRACEADGVDPDKIGMGVGQTMPVGVKYPLWKARVKIVQAILDEMAIADAELAARWEARASEVLETVEIQVIREKLQVKPKYEPGECVQIRLRDGETIRQACERLGIMP